MTTHITARDAFLNELEAAESALAQANERYADDERATEAAQNRSAASCEYRAEKARDCHRLKKALAILEGDAA